MKRRLSVEFNRIFMLLLKRVWIFVVIMAVFMIGGCMSGRLAESETVTYTATGKILVAQLSGEEVGDLMDNASRVQPTYDSIEVLTAGSFLKTVCDSLPFDMTLDELKAGVVIDQQPSTRVLNVHVTCDTAEKVKSVMTTFMNTAQSYISTIMPEVNVVILEDADTASLQVNQSSTNGLKTGTLMGLVVCALTAFIFIVLYLSNNTIRYRDEVEDILGIPVIGTVKDKK